MKNSGIEYEELIQQIFKSIANQENVTNVDIRRNVILKGKAGGTHQIDVFWEFEHLGINHKVIIEAKDYASKITQEKLHAFKCLLEDIPGQPRGIYVTKTGYQAGAKNFAEHHGISLYELRKPTDEDWSGKMRDLYMDIEYHIPHVENIHFDIDYEWLDIFCKGHNVKMQEKGYFTGDCHSKFLDERSNVLCSLEEKINRLIKSNIADLNNIIMNAPINISEKFITPTYITNLNKLIPKLKIKGIHFTLFFSILHDKTEIHGDDIVRYILKDVLNNNIKRIGNSMQILDIKNQ